MTEPSDAAKKLACELANEQEDRPGIVWVENDMDCATLRALALRLDFVDKVAREIAEGAAHLGRGVIRDKARSLMLPDEPDPLAESVRAASPESSPAVIAQVAANIRAEMAKRGGKIVWEEK